MHWILIIYLIGYDGNGTSLVKLDNFNSKESCGEQGELWIKSKVFTDKPGFFGGGYVCINADR